jgi:Leucine-rich repeat (LRR) protein
LATVGANDFLFSPNVETLDLSSNKIDRVDVGALRHLANLKTLHLSDNQLSSLSPPPW